MAYKLLELVSVPQTQITLLPLRRIVRFVGALEKHARSIVLTSAVLMVGLLSLASRLELRTDLMELLPADHPAVAAMRTVAPRQRSASNLVLLIEGSDATKVAAFADALKPALTALVPTTLTAIDWAPDTGPAEFADQWRWLYIERNDLEELDSLIGRLIARQNPLYVDLDDSDPMTRLRELQTRAEEKQPKHPIAKRFESTDGKTIGVRLWRRRDGLGGPGDHQAITAVMAAVKRTQPAQFGDVKIRLTGPVAQAVEEQASIREDLGTSTVLCIVLVFAVMFAAFGNVSLVFAALVPTVLGLLTALALAAVALGALNLNTAFLISIILGNGINAPIVLLAALRFHHRPGRPFRRSLWRAMVTSLRGVSAAMLTAAAAYAVLGATRFRGFQQFGLIGGVGMVSVLIATFVVLPPLLFMIEAWRPGRLLRGRDHYSPLVSRVLAWLAPRRRAVPLAIGLSLASIGGAVHFARDPIEWNLRLMRSKDGEATRLWPKMEQLGMGSVGAGYIANTGVMLVDDAADADKVADALIAQDLRTHHFLKTARTLSSLLPHDQDAKLVVLARLRQQLDRVIDKHADWLKPEDLQRLRDLRPPETLRVVTADDLPAAIRDAFTEVDGTRGRFVGIDADRSRFQDWDGHALLKLSSALSVVVDGHTYVAASASTIFAGMLQTLIADAPRIAGIAIVVVSLLVLLLFGADARFVLGALALGLLWLTGAAGILGLHLNFMSFAALPISIGVGTDYAANLWAQRRHQDGPPIGATVVLCSLTTIIGYSTLLLGRNGALRSFGLLCDVGEVTCLLAAVLSLSLFRRTKKAN